MNRRLVLAFCILMASCSRGGPTGTTSTLTPASELKGEAGSITVYSGRSQDLIGPVIERFTQATGIEAQVKYGDTAELAALILEEGANSPADLFFAQDAGALGALSKESLFVSLPRDLTGSVAAAYRSPEDHWVGTTGRVRVLVFNTETVDPDDIPGSVLGLADSKWKDQIGWAPTNGSFQAFVTGLRKLKRESVAKEWLEDVKAKGARVYPRNDPIVEAVAAGEIKVGLVNHYYLMNLRRQKPEMKAENHFFQNKDPGSLVNVAGVGILKSSEAQKTAGSFIEFLLAAETQQYFAEKTSEYPLIKGVAAPAGLPSLDELDPPQLDLSDLDDLRGTLELLKEVGLL